MNYEAKRAFFSYNNIALCYNMHKTAQFYGQFFYAIAHENVHKTEQFYIYYNTELLL